MDRKCWAQKIGGGKIKKDCRRRDDNDEQAF